LPGVAAAETAHSLHDERPGRVSPSQRADEIGGKVVWFELSIPSVAPRVSRT
jgi:hypothetical protein